MPIRVSCPCGRQLNVSDEVSGKLIRCPECSGTVRVPVVKQATVQKRKAGRHESSAPTRREVRPKKPKSKQASYLPEADPYDDLSDPYEYASQTRPKQKVRQNSAIAIRKIIWLIYREKLRQLPYIQMFHSLSFRHMHLAERTRGLSGAEVVAIGFDTGILDGQGFRIRPDRIEIIGDIAWIRDSRTDILRMKMVREDDGWKVSLVELYSQLDRIMATQISGDRELYALQHLDVAKYMGPATESLFTPPAVD